MKSFIILGSVLTGIAIIIGAFGAHAMKTKICQGQESYLPDAWAASAALGVTATST